MRPANGRRRYIVTASLICWAHAQNDPCAVIALEITEWYASVCAMKAYPVKYKRRHLQCCYSNS